MPAGSAQPQCPVMAAWEIASDFNAGAELLCCSRLVLTMLCCCADDIPQSYGPARQRARSHPWPECDRPDIPEERAPAERFRALQRRRVRGPLQAGRSAGARARQRCLPELERIDVFIRPGLAMLPPRA